MECLQDTVRPFIKIIRGLYSCVQKLKKHIGKKKLEKYEYILTHVGTIEGGPIQDVAARAAPDITEDEENKYIELLDYNRKRPFI